MDILPFTPIFAPSESDSPIEQSEMLTRSSLLEVDNEKDWCLFTVDVKNGYTLPFEVCFERNQKGTTKFSASRLVSPGSTSR